MAICSRDITRHHRTASGEQETASYLLRLIAAARVAADGAGGASFAVDEGAAAVRAARGAEELEPKLCCGPC